MATMLHILSVYTGIWSLRFHV